MIGSKSRSAARRAAAVVFALAALAARTDAQDAARAPRLEAADDKRWQTVAPGRVEPSSGEIKVATPVMGVIAQVLVKVNDKVSAGEPLIRLIDNEAQARLAAALSLSTIAASVVRRAVDLTGAVSSLRARRRNAT